MKIYPGQVGTAMGATGPQFGQPRSPRAVSASSEVRGSLEAGSALFEGFWYRPRVPPTAAVCHQAPRCDNSRRAAGLFKQTPRSTCTPEDRSAR